MLVLEAAEEESVSFVDVDGIQTLPPFATNRFTISIFDLLKSFRSYAHSGWLGAQGHKIPEMPELISCVRLKRSWANVVSNR